ncbi:hypothetical protein [Parasediminibacterium sp. JCM 36343]|uniref:hypothetical protein n=1 Tax=Parasediminibacterium sp. JCM 36343 TaxID=3374279 RepID=UPI003978A582
MMDQLFDTTGQQNITKLKEEAVKNKPSPFCGCRNNIELQLQKAVAAKVCGAPSFFVMVFAVRPRRHFCFFESQKKTKQPPVPQAKNHAKKRGVSY